MTHQLILLVTLLRGQGGAPAPAALTRAGHWAKPSPVCAQFSLIDVQYIAPCKAAAGSNGGAASARALTPPPVRVFARAADARAVGAHRCGAVPAGVFAVRVASFAPWQFARALQPSCQSCRLLRHHARRPRPRRLPRGVHTRVHAQMQGSSSRARGCFLVTLSAFRAIVRALGARKN